MNLGELHTQIVLGMGEKAELTPASLNIWINLAQQALARRHRFRVLDASQVTTVPGTLDLTLPTWAVLSSIWYLDGATGFEVDWLDRADFYAEYPSVDLQAEQGTPKRFYVHGLKAYFQPYPVLGSFKLWGTRKPTAITSNSLTTVTPELDYPDVLIYGAQLIGMQRLQYDKDEIDRVTVLYRLALEEAIIEDSGFCAGVKKSLKGYGANLSSGIDVRNDPLAKGR
jgi:hypothetical protein